jgi:hypothetical protein
MLFHVQVGREPGARILTAKAGVPVQPAPPLPSVSPEGAVSSTKSELLKSWRAAQRVQDGHAADDRGWASRDQDVGVARRAYLEAVREGAVKYSFAAGSKTVLAELESVREAERRQADAAPDSPAQREAARDVRLRTDRVATRTDEDRAQSKKTAEALRRVMGLAD